MGSQEYHTVPDESYWAALLEEGENAKSAYTGDNYEVNGSDIEQSKDVPPQILLEAEADWDQIERITNNDDTLELNVIGCNRGGLLVTWRSLHGFVPASQLINFPNSRSYEVRHNALLDRVGQTLFLRVIELDPEKNRLILSERAAQVEAGQREEVLQSLEPGSITSGIITNLCDFGAFVDLGGVEGLIHISELSWGRVAHPSDILKSGQRVKAYVLDLDREACRIALSLKRLHPDPWKTVQDRYQIDQIVEGEITHVVDFGAFACIEEGLEGLIHISELAEGHFLHPRNVVEEGDRVKARILNIDGKARRLGLSLRLV